MEETAALGVAEGSTSVHEAFALVEQTTTTIEKKVTSLAQLKKIPTNKKTLEQGYMRKRLNKDVNTLRESHLQQIEIAFNKLLLPEDPSLVLQIIEIVRALKVAETQGHRCSLGDLPPLEVSHVKNGEKV